MDVYRLSDDERAAVRAGVESAHRCDFATEREIEELAHLADQSALPTPSRKDANHRAELNNAFHLRLATMAHNRELMRLEGSVLERALRLAYSVAYSIGAQDQEMSLQTLHRPIVDAIRRRDRSAARECALNKRGVAAVVGARQAEGRNSEPRVVRPEPTDWAATPGLHRMLAHLETKTVWHPIGV